MHGSRETEPLCVRLERDDDFRDYRIEGHAEFSGATHDVLAVHRPRERFVLHFPFYRRNIDISDVFRRTNERDGDDEAAQLIDGVEGLFDGCFARDVCVICVRKNCPADFFTPAVLAQPGNADEWMAFGRAAFQIRMALIIHVMEKAQLPPTSPRRRHVIGRNGSLSQRRHSSVSSDFPIGSTGAEYLERARLGLP